MSLIKSISGIRGTIGGKAGEGLNPLDTVKFVSAYATYIKSNKTDNSNAIVVGRDARISGKMMEQLVIGTLMGMGFDVVNIGLATTPTTELAVAMEGAAGGIILTASHNPRQWNALKLLDSNGEFLSAKAGEEILTIAEKEDFHYAEVDQLGKVTEKDYTDKHIQAVLELALVDVEAIKAADFEVSIDCVNSVGGIVIPKLLKALGVRKVNELYCTPDGNFPHNPEPLPEHLQDIANMMKTTSSDVGFVVDPDVDRLAIICENGDMFGEEYTLVAVADYILSHTKGNTVSNLSSSRALRDVTHKHGCEYYAAAVGEVNVTTKMKEVGAVIGGEGNGGVIYPASHYGRDSLVGIALFLTHLANEKKTVSELRAGYPQYYMGKQKVELTPNIDVDKLLEAVKEKYSQYEITDIDGVKIDFPDKWVHLRKSNTEPIIRVYSEAHTQEEAMQIGGEVMNVIKELAR
ncbi:phosphoglucosamine mutase [Dysgonomonas sp. 25]|uniref:phosphoglucosamine mutase n=1 Tax=Dysgonomonas sp. 25 TaxID=2302933 RepID=UPI0013D519A9|nr:phosphoglucosamine mutase [Dysgonomonas sp. 25]NDV68307.1 phosphoglucosamine mutase [Dysgonomonas sp. 25]